MLVATGGPGWWFRLRVPSIRSVMLAGEGCCVKGSCVSAGRREILRPAKPRRIFYCPKLKGVRS
jgi:hypothetical protein